MTLTKDDKIKAFRELVKILNESPELRDFIEMWTKELLEKLENKKGGIVKCTTNF